MTTDTGLLASQNYEREALCFDGRIMGPIPWPPYCKQSQNQKKMEIEIDSQDPFSLICSSNIDNHPLFILTHDCRCLLSKFEGIKLSRNKRSQNFCVDAMETGRKKIQSSLENVRPPPIFCASALYGWPWKYIIYVLVFCWGEDTLLCSWRRDSQRDSTVELCGPTHLMVKDL